MDKVKALLTPAPAKALGGRELILVTKDVAGTSLCTPEQLSQTCGHQECSWKRNGSLDGPPSDVLPKMALHPAGSMTSRLLAGYFIKCFQQASNYQMQLPLNTGMLHEGWCPAEATRLNSNFRLAQPPRNSDKSPSAEQGEASSAFQCSRSYLHWYITEPCKHTHHTPCALASATWMHHQGQSLSHDSLSEPAVPLLLHSCLFLAHPSLNSCADCALSAFHPNPLPGLQPALLN